MKILIAPDKFKGTLNAREVAQHIAQGLLDVLPDAQIEIVPMADGGEGTAEAICDARGCVWVECKAHDPLGREIDVRYGWIDEEKIAVMEMSEAAGMRGLSQNERDPIRATTFGVGQMILDATKRGANEINGVGIQRLFGSQRALKSVEDFTEFEQRAAYFDGDQTRAARKGVSPLERGSQVHSMGEFQNLLDFPPAPKLNILGRLDPGEVHRGRAPR